VKTHTYRIIFGQDPDAGFDAVDDLLDLRKGFPGRIRSLADGEGQLRSDGVDGSTFDPIQHS